MENWLLMECGGELETPPTHPNRPKGMIQTSKPGWTETAVIAVEKAINTLLDDYIMMPFLHRVEH
jgi:hypothetical protein